MKNHRLTIRKITSMLNNESENGGFWLPNIQRPFVWSEEQICKLFDSIMREYPISTFLIWRTTSSIKVRKFIDNWVDGLKLTQFNVPENIKPKNLVLDGQQRLQSLFIGLKGSFNGKELYFDILSGTTQLPDEIKYKFRFISKSEATFPNVLFKELVETNYRIHAFVDDLKIRNNDIHITQEEINRISDNFEIVHRAFKSDEVITYQELDSIDYPGIYKEDDVVEIFIRANSGGTKLEKSDLLFSLLSSSWDDANKEMEILLDDLNKSSFEFGRDFVLKTCLVLLDQGARYEVDKFRKNGIRENIQAEWDSISDAIRDVVDFVKSKTYIQCHKALSSYLALIPLIYFRYKFPGKWKSIQDADTYLLETLLAGVFGGQSDGFMDSLIRNIRDSQSFNKQKIEAIIRESGKSLEIPESKIWQMGYGSKNIHLLFNIWYQAFNHSPAYENSLPQIDHIFPVSKLKLVKVDSADSGRKVMKYKDVDRNQLANCMLLTREENGAGGKSDILPKEWFASKDDKYLEMHLIPKDKELWELENYEKFIVARKELIKKKLRNYITTAV